MKYPMYSSFSWQLSKLGPALHVDVRYSVKLSCYFSVSNLFQVFIYGWRVSLGFRRGHTTGVVVGGYNERVTGIDAVNFVFVVG